MSRCDTIFNLYPFLLLLKRYLYPIIEDPKSLFNKLQIWYMGKYQIIELMRVISKCCTYKTFDLVVGPIFFLKNFTYIYPQQIQFLMPSHIIFSYIYFITLFFLLLFIFSPVNCRIPLKNGQPSLTLVYIYHHTFKQLLYILST